MGGSRDGVAGGLGDRAYLRLVELLSSDALPCGTKLPTEIELARQLAVSRPVLRQALSRLRMEGRVRTRKGSGTYVQAAPKTTPIAFGPLDSIPDVRSFLEFRCSVEGEIAAHAARHGGRTGLKAIRAACHKLEAEVQEGRPGIEEDVAFHLALAEASGNRFFVSLVTSLREQTVFGIRLTRELSTRPLPDRFAEIQREHARIVAAITAEDAEAARQAMSAHLQGGICRLFGRPAA